MNQSIIVDKLCKYHNKKILSFSIDQNCNTTRLFCIDCQQNDKNSQYLQNSIEYENLEQYLKSTQSKCIELQSKLTLLMDSFVHFFKRIQQGINDKYNIPFDRINKINNDQLEEYLSNILNFHEYENYLEHQFITGFNEFEKNLANCLKELKLGNLSYNEINQYDKEQSEILYKQGYILYSEQNNFTQAMEYFDRALAHNPHHFPSIWCKGASLKMLGKYKEQIDWYDKALIIDPKHVLSLFGKGDALRLMGQFSESIKWYDKALQVDPKHVLSLFGRGDALKMLGLYESSLEWYQKALQIDHQHALSLFGIGDSLRLMRQYKESLEWYDKALQIDPNHELSLYGKGDALRILQQYPVALEYLDKALLKNPDDHLSLGSKGACLISMERYQEALICLNKAIHIDPNNRFCKKQLSICQEKMQKLCE